MRIAVIWLMLGTQLLAGGIYSYVDESGNRVFTNLGSSRQAQSPVPSGDEILSAGGNFGGLIKDSSSRYEVDEELVQAIIEVESNFNPNAVSPKNCKGLMQLHPDTARRFGVQDIFDPAENIEGGVKYLSYLIDYFDNDLDHVLAAYNAGENAVKRHGGIPPYRETIAYVDKVKSLFQGTPSPSPENIVRNRRIVRLIDAEGYLVFTNSE